MQICNIVVASGCLLFLSNIWLGPALPSSSFSSSFSFHQAEPSSSSLGSVYWQKANKWRPRLITMSAPYLNAQIMQQASVLGSQFAKREEHKYNPNCWQEREKTRGSGLSEWTSTYFFQHWDHLVGNMETATRLCNCVHEWAFIYLVKR